ncbi:MAG: hypothetical protein Q7K41_01410 [Dehalococcoidales bacterium]|nr:hypothetical protein [Dehalococcoidales bacterium]
MEQRKKLLEEREQLKKEHAKRTKIWMDAFNKRDDLLPKLRDTPGGVIATLVLTTRYAEYDKAAEEEREAFTKLRETEEKIGEINTKLQS